MHDTFAIAFVNSEWVAGRFKFLSKLKHAFIQHAEQLSCEKTESKRYLTDPE